VKEGRKEGSNGGQGARVCKGMSEVAGLRGVAVGVRPSADQPARAEIARKCCAELCWGGLESNRYINQEKEKKKFIFEFIYR